MEKSYGSSREENGFHDISLWCHGKEERSYRELEKDGGATRTYVAQGQLL